MEMDRIGQRQNDPLVNGGMGARRVERTAPDARPKTESERTQGPTDSVEISSRSRELARARQAVEDAPDVRADKIAEIKRRIEDGTYSVSPHLLAQKLLEGSNDGV